MSKFVVQFAPSSLSKRRPQRNRVIAKKAADDIRARTFDCIYDAVSVHFSELAGKSGERERRKDFARYIYEDLKNGPKSLHVFFAMSKYSKKRNEQPNIRAQRYKNLLSILRA